MNTTNESVTGLNGHKAGMMPPNTELEASSQFMPYDIAVLTNNEFDITPGKLNTINYTQVIYQLRKKRVSKAAPVCDFKEQIDYVSSNNPKFDTPDEIRRGILFNYVYNIIKDQVRRQVYKEIQHDRYIDLIFQYIHKQISTGEYEHAKEKNRLEGKNLRFSQWIRQKSKWRIFNLLRESGIIFVPVDEKHLSILATPETDEIKEGQKENLKIIEQAILKLAPSEKEVMEHVIKNPFLSTEIRANELGVQPTTIYNRLNRARKKLKKILKENAINQ